MEEGVRKNIRVEGSRRVLWNHVFYVWQGYTLINCEPAQDWPIEHPPTEWGGAHEVLPSLRTYRQLIVAGGGRDIFVCTVAPRKSFMLLSKYPTHVL